VLKLSHLTDEFLKIPVRGILAGNDIDPTGYDVAFAFMLTGTPAGGDWLTAQWETDATVTPARYYATAKATTLAVGTYTIWLQLDTGTELVREPVDQLQVI
jgi:hypothetical protein